VLVRIMFVEAPVSGGLEGAGGIGGLLARSDRRLNSATFYHSVSVTRAPLDKDFVGSVNVGTLRSDTSDSYDTCWRGRESSRLLQASGVICGSAGWSFEAGE
jgi:hypothetical protein